MSRQRNPVIGAAFTIGRSMPSTGERAQSLRRPMDGRQIRSFGVWNVGSIVLLRTVSAGELSWEKQTIGKGANKRR
jgi:hypothetical protein